MAVRIYSTLTGREDELVPMHADGVLRIYVCGMTPKFDPHVGHARLFVAMDVMRRYLTFRGYKLRFVQNFTDVDDKIIQRAASQGRSAAATASAYMDSYYAVMDRLNVQRADEYPTVTGTMERIVEFIAGLVEHHAYRASNVQVNMLANGIVNDPPDEADLGRAIEVMLKTTFLGVVALFNCSLIAGQHFLRPIFPSLALAQQPANASSGQDSTTRMEKFRQACDPDIYAELLRLNALDSELLNRARTEVRRRFSLVPDAAARLRELEQSIKEPKT